MGKPIEIFISYASKDQDRAYFEELQKRLRPLERKGLLQSWSYANISAGTDWKKEVGTYLNTAQVILLLISPDFMASDYCYSVEMQQAMQRHDRGEVKVIPIILRPTYNWKDAPFGKLQALPTDALPIKKWINEDDAFISVIAGIDKAAENFSPLPSVAPYVETPLKEESPEQSTRVTPITPSVPPSERIKWALIGILCILCLAILPATFREWLNLSSFSPSSKSPSPMTASQLSTNPTITVNVTSQPTPLATLTSLPTAIGSTSLASVKNLNIPCSSISDGRNPAQTDCKADFPLSLTLKSIDLKQHPTIWNFMLTALPSGQELFCARVQFTNVQLTDAQGNIYPAGGYTGPWSLNTTQSQQVPLTFDIPQSGSTFQLNVSIHNCHYYTTYRTLSFSA